MYDLYFDKVTYYVISKCERLCDVEDVVQEVFFEFYGIIEKKGAKYIKNAEALIIYLAKIKIQRFYIQLKKQKKQVPFFKENAGGEEYETFDIDNPDIEDIYVNNQTILEVWEILSERSPDIQKIFALYYYCGNTIKEISEIMEISQSMVKHKLYRTLEQIRKIYKKDVKIL